MYIILMAADNMSPRSIQSMNLTLLYELEAWIEAIDTSKWTEEDWQVIIPLRKDYLTRTT